MSGAAAKKLSTSKEKTNDKSTQDDKTESRKRKATDPSESTEKTMTPSERLKARMRSQLNKVSSNDKNKSSNWYRSDLKKFTKEWSEDISRPVDMKAADKLMDDEDREYEKERFQKGKITMKDVAHAEAIFGKMSDKDLKYLDVDTNET